MKSVKESLERLIEFDKKTFDVIIKIANPKVDDEDLKPMFPEGWANDSRWPEDTETNSERWAKWQPHQIRIDDDLERMMGCYDSDDDC